MSTVSHHLNSGFHNWSDQPKLFTIWSCWTIYTLLCLIAFCASVQCTHSQWHMHWHTVFKHACCQVSSYHCPSFLPVYGEYIPVLLWGIVWINELSDITLYDEICPHCTLHMMNWVPRRQNEASAVFVCRYVFRKWESPVQECGKCFKYTILQNSLESLKEIEVERTPETNNCREYVPCSENYKWVIFHFGCFFVS